MKKTTMFAKIGLDKRQYKSQLAKYSVEEEAVEKENRHKNCTHSQKIDEEVKQFTPKEISPETVGIMNKHKDLL